MEAIPYVDPYQNVCEVKIHTDTCPHVAVTIFNKTYDALLDSGASVSVTSLASIAEENGLSVHQSPVKIVTADRLCTRAKGL